MAKKKTKNKKLKKDIKDAVFLTVIICLVIVALFAIISLAASPTNTFILQKNKISSEDSKVGYIIREEHIIDETKDINTTIEPIKGEGERVSAKNAVFKYYNVDQEEITKQIDDLNAQIQEALLGQTDLFSSDVKSIESQIEMQLNDVKEENNMQNVKEFKNNIANYIIKKAKIAGSLSAAGQYINDLISQRSKLEQSLNDGSKFINSIYSGVVSYRIDGLENELTIDKLNDLTVKELEQLNITTGQIVAKSTNQAKIVNNFECYIAIPFGKEVFEKTHEGDTVLLRIFGNREIKAKVFKIIDEGNKSIVIYKIADEVEDLINYRKIAVDVIWWEYEGLMVPKSTILYDNVLSYVIRKKNGKFEKILIKILKQNDNYCIIDNYTANELQELGFSSDEIKSIKSIKLYDEIMTDPDMEQYYKNVTAK